MKNRLTATDLHGIIPAIPTPTTAEDKVDKRAVRTLMDYLLKGGVNGVLPLGGTGEFCSLSHEQRVQMVAACAEGSRGSIPVVAGVLHPGFYDAVLSCKAFAEAGADALMVLTPYYTTPSQAGIRDYFLRIADASPVPIMIYEIPYRTRISVAPDVVHELSRHENIVGMKSSNPDLYQFLKIVSGVADTFSVFSGEDTLFPLHMAGGAKGGIIVTASVLPKTWKAMYQAGKVGDHATAISMHRKLIPLIDLSFGEVNPGPLKAVWDLVGVDAPHVLAPLVSAGEELRNNLRAELSARLKDEAKLA
jgi:4-hydroxy-tetrahydrodipicolinate synthase